MCGAPASRPASRSGRAMKKLRRKRTELNSRTRENICTPARAPALQSFDRCALARTPMTGGLWLRTRLPDPAASPQIGALPPPSFPLLPRTGGHPPSRAGTVRTHRRCPRAHDIVPAGREPSATAAPRAAGGAGRGREGRMPKAASLRPRCADGRRCPRQPQRANRRRSCPDPVLPRSSHRRTLARWSGRRRNRCIDVLCLAVELARALTSSRREVQRSYRPLRPATATCRRRASRSRVGQGTALTLSPGSCARPSANSVDPSGLPDSARARQPPRCGEQLRASSSARSALYSEGSRAPATSRKAASAADTAAAAGATLAMSRPSAPASCTACRRAPRHRPRPERSRWRTTPGVLRTSIPCRRVVCTRFDGRPKHRKPPQRGCRRVREHGMAVACFAPPPARAPGGAPPPRFAPGSARPHTNRGALDEEASSSAPDRIARVRSPRASRPRDGGGFLLRSFAHPRDPHPPRRRWPNVSASSLWTARAPACRGGARACRRPPRGRERAESSGGTVPSDEPYPIGRPVRARREGGMLSAGTGDAANRAGRRARGGGAGLGSKRDTGTRRSYRRGQPRSRGVGARAVPRHHGDGCRDPDLRRTRSPRRRTRSSWARGSPATPIRRTGVSASPRSRDGSPPPTASCPRAPCSTPWSRSATSPPPTASRSTRADGSPSARSRRPRRSGAASPARICVRCGGSSTFSAPSAPSSPGRSTPASSRSTKSPVRMDRARRRRDRPARAARDLPHRRAAPPHDAASAGHPGRSRADASGDALERCSGLSPSPTESAPNENWLTEVNDQRYS